MDRLTKWAPFKDFLDVRDDFDKIVDKWFKPELEFLGEHRVARVDIYRENDNVVVKAELPGLKKDDISLSLNEGILTISGKHSDRKEEKRENYYRKEIRQGSFARSVELPCKVDREKINATYKDGVLLVLLPVVKEEKEKETTIEIK